MDFDLSEKLSTIIDTLSTLSGLMDSLFTINRENAIAQKIRKKEKYKPGN
jgi:hypothetical protein